MKRKSRVAGSPPAKGDDKRMMPMGKRGPGPGPQPFPPRKRVKGK